MALRRTGRGWIDTREGDAIAAARRRLPMVETDASLALIGPDGRPIPQWSRLEAGHSDDLATPNRLSA